MVVAGPAFQFLQMLPPPRSQLSSRTHQGALSQPDHVTDAQLKSPQTFYSLVFIAGVEVEGTRTTEGR